MSLDMGELLDWDGSACAYVCAYMCALLMGNRQSSGEAGIGVWP